MLDIDTRAIVRLGLGTFRGAILDKLGSTLDTLLGIEGTCRCEIGTFRKVATDDLRIIVVHGARRAVPGSIGFGYNAFRRILKRRLD